MKNDTDHIVWSDQFTVIVRLINQIYLRVQKLCDKTAHTQEIQLNEKNIECIYAFVVHKNYKVTAQLYMRD